MDPVTTSAIISAASGLGGALIGATAAVIGPAVVQKRQLAEQERRERRASRTRAVSNYVSAMLDYAQYDWELGPNEPLARATNRAHMELTLSIARDEERARQFVDGLHRAVVKSSGATRWRTVNHGGQVLIDWDRDVITDASLTPFEFVEHGPDDELLVRPKEAW